MSNTALDEQMVPWVAPVLVHGRQLTGNSVSGEGDGDDDSVSLEEHERQLEVAQQEGYQRGFEQGKIESLNANEAEKQQLAQLMQNLTRPLAQFDDDVMQELLQFATTMAKFIVKREIDSDSDYYRTLIEQICTEYAKAHPAVSLTLHPSDFELAQGCVTAEDKTDYPRLLTDSDLPRGSCLVDTGEFFVDFGVDALIGRVAATLDQ